MTTEDLNGSNWAALREADRQAILKRLKGNTPSRPLDK